MVFLSFAAAPQQGPSESLCLNEIEVETEIELGSGFAANHNHNATLPHLCAATLTARAADRFCRKRRRQASLPGC